MEEKVLKITGFTYRKDIKNETLLKDDPRGKIKLLVHTVEDVEDTLFGVTTKETVCKSYALKGYIKVVDIKDKLVRVTVRVGKLSDGRKLEFIQAWEIKEEK